MARRTVAVVLAISLAQAALADDVRTARFQEGVDGYRGTHDVVVMSFDPDANDDSTSLRNDIADNEPEHFVETLLKFESLVGEGKNEIPAGAKIHSATLHLTAYNGGSGIVIHRVLEPWSEKSTWKSLDRGLDRFVKTPDDRRGKSGHRRHVVRGLVKLDVTASLRAWVENGETNHGWVLRAPVGGTDSVGIRSSEFEQAARRPLLSVEFTSGK